MRCMYLARGLASFGRVRRVFEQLRRVTFPSLFLSAEGKESAAVSKLPSESVSQWNRVDTHFGRDIHT